MRDLSEKEKNVYEYLKKEIRIAGYPPSIRELCAALNMKSTSTAHYYLKKLEEKGYIERVDNMNRAIKIVEKDEPLDTQEETVSVPIVGHVAAGTPILAEENISDYFPLPASQLGRGTYFLLKVQGDSMMNAGILHGDYVLVKQKNYANNGDLVVAMIDNEATVKTYYQENDYIRLQPHNDAYSPILVHGEVSILGEVTAVMRFFQ